MQDHDPDDATFGACLAIVLGFIMMIVGLGLGVTMIMLPVGIVIGLLGVVVLMSGLFARIVRSASRVGRSDFMLDRLNVETVLTHRFPGTTHGQVAAAANAIMGLDDEWDEVVDQDQEMGYQYSADCRDICYLAREFDRGTQFRFFRRCEK